MDTKHNHGAMFDEKIAFGGPYNSSVLVCTYYTSQTHCKSKNKK